jgi:hypothetical protein
MRDVGTRTATANKGIGGLRRRWSRSCFYAGAEISGVGKSTGALFSLWWPGGMGFERSSFGRSNRVFERCQRVGLKRWSGRMCE